MMYETVLPYKCNTSVNNTMLYLYTKIVYFVRATCFDLIRSSSGPRRRQIQELDLSSWRSWGWPYKVETCRPDKIYHFYINKVLCYRLTCWIYTTYQHVQRFQYPETFKQYRCTGHQPLGTEFCDFSSLILKNSMNVAFPYVRSNYVLWTPLNVSIYCVINTIKPAATPIESSTTEFDLPRRCKSWRVCIRFSVPIDTTQRWRRTTIYSTSPNIRRGFLLYW